MDFASEEVLGCIVAGERQHFGDVLFVLLADLLGFVVRFGVVIAIRKAETALVRAANHLRTIFFVLRGAEIKERVDAQALQPRDFFLQFTGAPHGVNPRKFSVEGFGARGINLFFVHAAGVKVSDFPFIGCGGRLRICRRLFKNLVQLLAISFGQLVEAPPTRIRRGDGILGQPLAARIAEEVLARLARLVQNRKVNAVRGRTGSFRAARLLPGAEDSDTGASKENKNGGNPKLPESRTFLQPESL